MPVLLLSLIKHMILIIIFAKQTILSWYWLKSVVVKKP